MVGRTYFKTVNRMFATNKVRLFLISAMTMISVAMVGGLGSVPPRMRAAVEYMQNEGKTGVTGSDGTWYDFAFILGQADGIERISIVFPIFFILVTSLVVFMTITRMIESERGQIACLKTLGYRQDSIVAKYIYFTLVATILGVVAGILLGHFGFATVIYNSVVAHWDMPNITANTPFVGIAMMLIMVAFSLAVAGFTALHVARQRPSKLLQGKAPVAGGRILFERIPFLWKPLPFRYKSSLRNIFRYRTRFVMTVFSMAFSTALVFCGMALSFSMEQYNPALMDTIRPIATIVVLAAICLNSMVIYNITNINIDERKREIATLKVLGYRNIEVSGYIFREIFILTLMGVIIGLPVGYFTMDAIFTFLRFGSSEYVDWYVWVLTAVLSLTSLALADLLLFRKIHKVDMNTSLKVVE